LVTSLFEEKNGKYGIRRLKMLFERRYKVTINLKKIIRIKKDFELVTRIRQRSKMRAVFKKGEEHIVAQNLLKRDFGPIERRTVFSTDITELHYLGGRRAYLSATKDLASNEIVHFNLLPRPTGEIVLLNLDETFIDFTSEQRQKMIIHSDQGCHYTSGLFRMKLKELGINQSMSRKGNCLDNAPIESFFGHLKDEVDYRSCKEYAEVEKLIEDYIYYYNNDRPQWNLKQKTPADRKADQAGPLADWSDAGDQYQCVCQRRHAESAGRWCVRLQRQLFHR